MGDPGCPHCSRHLPCFAHFLAAHPSKAPTPDSFLQPCDDDDAERLTDPDVDSTQDQVEERDATTTTGAKGGEYGDLLQLWIRSHCDCPGQLRRWQSWTHLGCLQKAQAVCAQMEALAAQTAPRLLLPPSLPLFSARPHSPRRSAESPDSLILDSFRPQPSVEERFRRLSGALSCDSLEFIPGGALPSPSIRSPSLHFY